MTPDQAAIRLRLLDAEKGWDSRRAMPGAAAPELAERAAELAERSGALAGGFLAAIALGSELSEDERDHACGAAFMRGFASGAGWGRAPMAVDPSFDMASYFGFLAAAVAARAPTPEAAEALAGRLAGVDGADCPAALASAARMLLTLGMPFHPGAPNPDAPMALQRRALVDKLALRDATPGGGARPRPSPSL